MMAKQPPFVDSSGTKAMVFSLDAAIAVSIAAVLMVSAAVAIASYTPETASAVPMLKLGYDVVAVLEQQGAFSKSEEGIKDDLLQLLPVNYDMRLAISSLNQSNATRYRVVESTGSNPSNRFVGAGEMVATTSGLEHHLVRFWIWVK